METHLGTGAYQESAAKHQTVAVRVMPLCACTRISRERSPIETAQVPKYGRISVQAMRLEKLSERLCYIGFSEEVKSDMEWITGERWFRGDFFKGSGPFLLPYPKSKSVLGRILLLWPLFRI